MKVSFVIVWSSSGKVEGYVQDSKLDKALTDQTWKVVNQILSFKFDKELILIDNSDDFPIGDFTNPDLKLVKGVQALYREDPTIHLDWFDKVKDIGPGLNLHDNHCSWASLGFQQGYELCSGDYVILQHNDTEYLFNYYPQDTIITHLIDRLEKKDLQYITIDKKPTKPNYQFNCDYYADCYWFLCRRNFYDDNNIFIDWTRGDTNHLATIYCVNNNLKFEHLPGYYENKEYKTQKGTAANTNWYDSFVKNYPELIEKKYFPQLNIHTFNSIPFLIHYKGGTGLSRMIKTKNYDPSN